MLTTPGQVLPFNPRSLQVGQQLAGKGVHAVLQPIADMRSGKVQGHESLIRGDQGHPLHSPDDLFRAARELDQLHRFEALCMQIGVRTWLTQGAHGLIFVNMSADALLAMHSTGTLERAAAELSAAGGSPASVVIEITEHERVTRHADLLTLAETLRTVGVRFALDDFGDGRSSLRLWAELRPEFVKVDKYFVHNVHNEAVKVQTLRGLLRLAELFDTRIIAEGIETMAELEVVRDLGIPFGQGYLLARPSREACKSLTPEVVAQIKSRVISVLPEVRRTADRDFAIGRIVDAVEPSHPACSINDLAERFARDEGLRAVAFVDGDVVQGLITRQALSDKLTKPFFRDIYGKRPALLFANRSPLQLDRRLGLDGATAVLTSPDQRYLTEGFIVTDNGRYLGLATGQQLVRMVTEARIEAARHANPLTFLPGNIPISEHIARLLASECHFVATYCDLNDFKPFNDHYGYWRGDDMILLLARTLGQHADPRRDFVGHVGGDDFVVLFQSDDWFDRCERALADFNEQAQSLFDEQALARGGIEAEDRFGVKRFFPCTTLSIGAVVVTPGRYSQPEQVASAAAAVKHKAKHSAHGLCVEQACGC